MRLINLTKSDVDVRWALEIQKRIAIPMIYQKVWPDCIFHHPDKQTTELEKALDIAGADKIIQEKTGGMYFLGQRFRTFESSLARGYDDLTLRHYRPRTDYKAEAYKVIDALKTGKLLAAFYGYGHLNREQTKFKEFRIIKFRPFVEEWVSGNLDPYQHKENYDGSSSFYAWRFRDIPKNMIYWDLKKQAKQKQTLGDFFNA